MELPVLRPFEVVVWGEDRHRPLDRIGVHSFSEDEAKETALGIFRQRIKSEVFLTIARVEVLSDVHLNPGRRQRTLFEDIADACVGASLADIQGAMVNMLLTAVQRRYVRVADAEARWDELMGRGKVALQKRYRKGADVFADRTQPVAGEDEIAKRLVG